MMFNSEMEAREMQDQYGAELGDARRCPRHPQVKMSSDDGMYDAACCDLCEGEMADAAEADRVAALSPEERATELADIEAEVERRMVEAEARMAAERAAWGDELPF